MGLGWWAAAATAAVEEPLQLLVLQFLAQAQGAQPFHGMTTCLKLFLALGEGQAQTAMVPTRCQHCGRILAS